MGRHKLKRFAQNAVANNVIEYGKPNWLTIKGQWAAHFGNDKPIVVELGCGRGEYSVGLGAAYPEKNFIGVDIKGSRIWKGSSQAIARGLHNVAFLRTVIQNLDTFFAPQEISEIWITFPDPRPRGRDERRRLTSLRFLQLYFDLLKPGGIVHLKTDSTGLFRYTLEVLEAVGVANLIHTETLYQSEWANDHLGIRTHYEGIWEAKGESIKYLRFSIISRPELPETFVPTPYPGMVFEAARETTDFSAENADNE